MEVSVTDFKSGFLGNKIGSFEYGDLVVGMLRNRRKQYSKKS